MWRIDTPSKVWLCASVDLCILLCVPLCRRGGSVGVCMYVKRQRKRAKNTVWVLMPLSLSLCVRVCAYLCISVCLCVSLWVYACGCAVRAWYTNGKYTTYTLRTLGAPLLKDNRHR